MSPSVNTLLLISLLAFPILNQGNRPVQKDPFEEKREHMVRRQIEARGVSDLAVLKAMRTVRRHLFVPPEVASKAYADHALPIGLGQTISQPYMVAYMTEVIRPTAQMKVLEIGTGSGYQAAVLAEIVREVYTIEIVPEHGVAAAARLKKLGYEQVQVKIGDGYQGWEEHAPYDAIVVTAGAETIPPPLLEQLKEGGRMVIPVGPAYRTQTLKLIEKKKGKLITKNLMPVIFVPFTRSGKN
ncbi:protein-L-isoaspartate(D-aspartate) O-methyltransferase [Pontibacter sp. JH31]|uniref:Protein-L-isoaspartate O-methyltransferase n=1 Tax=Pontibacter aquaedesilientis TaxID=2766980 RepID=A0ABR7XBV6_9BACT|nr:protein-L-isoaspartate(D-aspartate) O-methyltransferase [Pontibacter aquaedesilientis]MBD1395779.1 protein-L-isoaspartate(D-aspartate) O-methyltransferase [Pontibacter aquaedesilientis]